ncbi:NADH dehydrogenase [ubiquinone] 1 alpha subcomplex assembly factor 3 [Armadillidium vulgare]|nr:NADH dehydrogenase [ubiquinone] 1 alpha subcomplex assembly factor 3 [Armadillidium vulgare]
MFLRNFNKILPNKIFIRNILTKENKTTAVFLNDAVGAPLMINSLNQKGFRLNNNFSVIGSMIIFPRTVLSWRVKEAEEVNVESLSLFTILEPKLVSEGRFVAAALLPPKSLKISVTDGQDIDLKLLNDVEP